jgi:hypothetical protein
VLSVEDFFMRVILPVSEADEFFAVNTTKLSFNCKKKYIRKLILKIFTKPIFIAKLPTFLCNKFRTFRKLNKKADREREKPFKLKLMKPLSPKKDPNISVMMEHLD